MDNNQTQPIVTSSMPTQQPVMQPPTRSKSRLKPLLCSLLAIVLLAAVGYGVYAWQHGKVNNADTKVSSLQSQVSSLQSQVSKLSKQTSTTTSNSTSGTGYLQIKELGIELPLSSTIADLTYTWDSTNSQAQIGSAALLKYEEAQDPSACTPPSGSTADTTYPLGDISKSSAPAGYTGNYKSYTVDGSAYTLYLPENGCVSSNSNVANQSGAYENALESALQSAKAL
jgi:outer membrane murein-binding lipoprotein Lpp